MVLRVTTSTRHSLASWHRPLLPPMALAKPGSQPLLDNGTEQEQFRVDTPGGEVCILGSTGLGYTLFVPELSQYTFVVIPLCNYSCAAFLLVSLSPF